MTRNIGNRIGSSINSPNDSVDSGLFNTLRYYNLRKKNIFDGSVDLPASIAPQTYTPGDGYTYVIFTGSDQFNITGIGRLFHYMVVGGGGGSHDGPNIGGGSGGGGGGAVRQGEIYLEKGLVTITIGAGAPDDYRWKPNGSPSSLIFYNTKIGNLNSIMTKIESPGGGRGGKYNPQEYTGYDVTPGGCGGGGAAYPSSWDGPIWRQGGNSTNYPDGGGKDGGYGGTNYKHGGGGGGGAGSIGGTGGQWSSTVYGGGDGGNGVAYEYSPAIPNSFGEESGSDKYFAGGGGGGIGYGPISSPQAWWQIPSSGGLGGGGDGYGDTWPYSSGQNGTINTGGGGGGGFGPQYTPTVSTTVPNASSGGSGITIIRYKTNL